MGKVGKLLIVEDNSDDELLTIRAFRKGNLGNEIDVVRDGEEALDYLFRRNGFESKKNESLPDLILLDLKMPKVSGLEVLQIIKNDPHLKALPVVVLTTSKDDSDLKKAYELGVNSYVLKPVSIIEFIEAIQKLEIYWFVLNQRPQRGQ